MFKFGKSKDKKDEKKTKTTSETFVRNETSTTYNVRRTVHTFESYSGRETGSISTSSSTKFDTILSRPDNLRNTSLPNLILKQIPYPGQSVNLPRMQPNYQSPFNRTRSERLPARTSVTSITSSSVVPAKKTLESDARVFQYPNTTTSISRMQQTVPRTTTAIPSPRNNTNSVVPTYSTNGSRRGTLIVINNIKFLDQTERKGAELDEKNIKKLFQDMGFVVKTHRDLKLADMKYRISKYRQDRDLGKGDMLIVVVMSHGTNMINNQQIPGSFTQILTVDQKCMNVEEVLSEFSNDKCEVLKGKPKIFIFQCCRGDGQELQVDAVPMTNVIKQHSDMLIAYSTVPGFVSLREPEKGSWYIQSICDVFKRHAKDHHVEDLLKLVDDELSNKHPYYKQTANYENRGFKQCFLNPR